MSIDVIEVLKDIVFVKHPASEDWFCGLTVVRGTEEIGIVDSGFADTPGTYLFPYLESQGLSPQTITMLYNTHGDGDHVQGNMAIKEACDTKVACHELEADSIAGVDLRLSDGDTIRLGDRTFIVVHCPGHRPGNSCLFDETDGLLISGDTIVGTRKELIRMGPEPYIASLKKIADLKPTTIVMSHPFQPAGTNVLDGDAIATILEASIRVAEEL